MNYGEKIAHLRKSKGMTQEELGKALSVTYQAVSKWERGESLPDFPTISQIAKIFEVPIDYFEDGGENRQHTPVTPPASAPNIAGMCTVCGKMLTEDEIFCSEPKIMCKSCHEKAEQKKLQELQNAEARRKYQRALDIKTTLGRGFDARLLVGLIVALICYAGLTAACFITASKDDAFLFGAIIFIAPPAAFACTVALFDFINELRDKDDEPEGYTLKLSLIIAAVFAVINIVLFLVLYLSIDKNFYFLILMIAGAAVCFTFISQIMWGSVAKDIFTCGGFTFKLPGFIFSLTPESIIMMIIVKFFLGILSILVFIVTTLILALVAMLGSVILFIPCIISKTVKDKKALAE